MEAEDLRVAHAVGIKLDRLRSGALAVSPFTSSASLDELRNAAATKGATHVYVDEEASPKLDRGTAYRCP